jgi:hypothetical protein
MILIAYCSPEWILGSNPSHPPFFTMRRVYHQKDGHCDIEKRRETALSSSVSFRLVSSANSRPNEGDTMGGVVHAYDSFRIGTVATRPTQVPHGILVRGFCDCFGLPPCSGRTGHGPRGCCYEVLKKKRGFDTHEYRHSARDVCFCICGRIIR